MSDYESDYIPDEIKNLAKMALGETLPEKSKNMYGRTYKAFKTWIEEKKRQ